MDGFSNSYATKNGSTDIKDLVECARIQSDIYIIYTVSIGPAVLIILTLSFFRKRKRKCPDFCNGRPGVVVPLNLLDEFEHRWSYACAFGAITNTILSILTGAELPRSQNENLLSSIKVLLSFYRALETCILFFPFFACLYTDQILLGSVLGFLYAVSWTIIKFVQVAQCPDPIPEVLPYATLLAQLPTIICLVVLLIRYASTCVLYILGKRGGSTLQRIEDSVVFPFQIDYVKELLKKPPPEVDWKSKELSMLKKIRAYFKKYYYDERHHFKFSTRVLCTLCVISICNYQMSLVEITISASAMQGLDDMAESIVNMSGILNSNTTRSIQENVDTVLILGKASWDISTGVAFLVLTFAVTGTLSNYRTHLLSLYRGDRSFVPLKYKATAAEYLANSMKFSGYQIAFVIWGHVVMMLALLCVTFVVSFALILPALNGNWTVISYILQVLVLPFIVSMLIRIGQRLASKYGFLQDKLEPNDEDQPLAVTNRRALHVANYFFFVANVATGFFSSLMRILKGSLFGVFYIGRMDQCVMMSGFERSDNGFNSYIGMLEVELTLNHPVLRVFCHIVNQIPADQERETDGHNQPPYSRRPGQILTQSLSNIPGITYGATESVEVDNISDISGVHDKPGKSRSRSRTRWLLLYTLINNPQLIHYRHLGGLKDDRDSTITELLTTSHSLYARYKLYTQIKANLAEMEIELMKERRRLKDAEVKEKDVVEMESECGNGKDTNLADECSRVDGNVLDGMDGSSIKDHKEIFDRSRDVEENPVLFEPHTKNKIYSNPQELEEADDNLSNIESSSTSL